MKDDQQVSVQTPAESHAMAELRDSSWVVTSTIVLGIVAGLLLALAMAGGMYWIGAYYLEESAPPPDAGKQTLRELRTADEHELGSYGWVNRPEGIVQVPIERAMELLASEQARELESSSSATPVK